MGEYCCCCPNCCVKYIRGPQGVQGAQGIQGVQGETGADGENVLSAYGGLYNTAVQPLTFTAVNTYVPLTLNMIMPIKNVTVSGNTLTINEAGDYEINYNVLVSASASVDMAVTVRNNGTVIPSTRGSQTLTYSAEAGLTHDGLFSGSAIVTLPAGAVLDIAISVINTLPTGLDAVVNNYANSTLSVKRLGSQNVPT